jgi:hypothetical protein
MGGVNRAFLGVGTPVLLSMWTLALSWSKRVRILSEAERAIVVSGRRFGFLD